MAKLSKKERKELLKDAQVILAIGEEGKKGQKAAKEYFEEEEKKEKAQRDMEAEILASKKKKITYNTYLAKILLTKLEDLPWPYGYKYRVAPNDRGVVLEIETRDRRYFRSAFASTGSEYYDLNAIDVYYLRSESLIERLTEPKTESGIYLPN